MRLITLFLSAFAVLLASATHASGLTEIKGCVFDPIGANGPSKEVVDEYKVAAIRWGIQVKNQYYTDDQEAMAAFINRLLLPRFLPPKLP